MIIDKTILPLSFIPDYVSRKAVFFVWLVERTYGGTSRLYRLQAQWKQHYIQPVVTVTLKPFWKSTNPYKFGGEHGKLEAAASAT